METLAIILVIVLIIPYFIPTIVALFSRHTDTRLKVLTFLTNLLLGWTIIGWIGALVWLALPTEKDRERYRAGRRSTDEESL